MNKIEYKEFPYGIKQVDIVAHHTTKLLKIIQKREDEELLSSYMIFLEWLDIILQEFLYESEKLKNITGDDGIVYLKIDKEDNNER